MNILRLTQSMIICLMGSLIATPSLSAPTVYTPTTVSQLITAINDSNTDGTDSIIDLSVGSVFTILGTEAGFPFVADGDNGLPSILVDGSLTFKDGTIERSSALLTPAFRLLHTETGAIVFLDNVTLQNGLAKGVGGSASGGAILNLGDLTITDSTIQNNVASGDGILPTDAPADAFGGAILHNGTGSLSISDSTFQDNHAKGGDALITASGGGGAARGGAIEVGNGTVGDIIGSTFDGNTAVGGNALLDINQVFGGGSGQGFGGAIAFEGSSANAISDVIFSNNIGQGGNAAADNTNDRVSAASDGQGGALWVRNNIATITLSTFSNNRASGSGAISSSCGGCTMEAQGSNGLGGAIWMENEIAEISFSTFDGNQALDGDNLVNEPPVLSADGGAGRGGAIYADSNITTLKNSTFSNNQVSGGNFLIEIGSELGSSDGAIWTSQIIDSLNNSTFSGNRTYLVGDPRQGHGGAIACFSCSEITLFSNTITQNTAGEDLGGGGIWDFFGTVNLTSNIVAFNTINGDPGAAVADIVEIDILRTSAVDIAAFNLIGVAGAGSGNNIDNSGGNDNNNL